jgi:hypothetical protein
MVCQLWPFVVRLGLSHRPCKGFTLVNSCIKKIRHREQVGYQCKKAGIGFQSFVANCAPIQRFATIEITPWKSAIKFRLLAVAIRGTILFLVCIPRSEYRGMQLSAVQILARFTTTEWNMYSTSHYTSTVPVRCIIYFWSETCQVQNQYEADCLDFNYLLMVSVCTLSRDTVPFASIEYVSFYKRKLYFHYVMTLDLRGLVL